MIAFALGAALLCGLICGLIPALHVLARSNQADVVRAPRAGVHAASRRLRNVLIVSEVAMALILLTGAGLMARTMQRLTDVEVGFRSGSVLTLRISMRGDGWNDGRRVAFLDDVLTRAQALPGIMNAGAVSSLPIDGSSWNNVFVVEGQPAPASHNDLPRTALTPVAGRYFETMGIQMLRGRPPDERDRAQGAPVVVVNESLARRAWPAGDPLGQRIKWGWPESPGTWRTIVGVAADVKTEGLAGEIPPQMYLPFAQVADSDIALTLKTAGDPASFERPVRDLIGQMDRNLPVYSVRVMDQIVGDSIARERLAVFVLTVIAGVALTLAAVGLFGTVARLVADRTHEIGVRLALGAGPWQVITSVVREALVMTAIGLSLGLAGALTLARLLRGLLFGVEPADPATLAAVVGVTLIAAALACYAPARRSTRIDPVVALRLD